MSGKKIGYWAVTGILAVGLFGSGSANVLGVEEVVKGVTDLGYPSYFPLIIGGWKFLGALAILVPRMGRLKEWAYAGLAFLFSGAVISHVAAGDPVAAVVAPLVLLGLATASYFLRPEGRRI